MRSNYQVDWKRCYILKYDLHNDNAFWKHIPFVGKCHLVMTSCLKNKTKHCLLVFLSSITLPSFLATKVRNHWSCAVRRSRMVRTGWKPFTKPGMDSHPPRDTGLSGACIGGGTIGGRFRRTCNSKMGFPLIPPH